MYVMHSSPLSHIYEIFFVKATFSKFIIFKIKNTFEPNVFKWIIKTKLLIQVILPFLYSMLKFSPIFKRNGVNLVEKKTLKKNKDCPLSSFVSNLEHVNFAIHGKYSKNNYDNPNYYVSLVIFQTYKNVVLKSGSFDYDFTLCFHERSNIATWELRRNLKRNFKRHL